MLRWLGWQMGWMAVGGWLVGGGGGFDWLAGLAALAAGLAGCAGVWLAGGGSFGWLAG